MFENFGEKVDIEKAQDHVLENAWGQGAEHGPESPENNRERDISSAHNFKELFEVLKTLKSIKGSREQSYDYYELEKLIYESYGAFFLKDRSEDNSDVVAKITNRLGLRNKVRELLEAEEIRRSL